MVQRAPHLPPIPAPVRPNLLTSVSPEPRPTEGRWTGGIAYTPHSYLTGWSVDPCGSVGEGAKPSNDQPAIVEWDPYWIGDDVTCSTFGIKSDDDFPELRQRLNEAFAVKQSHLIEEVLWTNTVDSADYGSAHPNVGLNGDGLAELSTVPTQAQIDSGSIYLPNAYDAVPPVTGFKIITEALTDQLNGARGMVHVERRILPLLATYDLVVQSGQRLLTSLGDHIVVPGTGYNGSSPANEAASDNYSWIYGTSMVEVLTAPPTPVGLDRESINRGTNQVTLRVEQLALAHWDRQAHAGVSICLEDPAGDCSDAGS